MNGRCWSLTIAVASWAASFVLSPLTADDGAAPSRPPYRSPLALALAPDGSTLYVSDWTAGNVSVLDVASRTKRAEIALEGQPAQIALSADGATLYVAQRGAGAVAVIDTKTNAVSARIPVARWPRALALGEKTRRLFVGNLDTNDVSVVDLAQPPGEVIARLPVLREPSDLALAPDERYLVVANQLPHGVGTDPSLAAKVSVIDCERLEVSAHIALPPGSTVVNGVCTSPDGKWAYVVHQLGRFNLPITQLQRGWVNTYALSILDIGQGRRLATLLLDDLTRGAADPYAVICSQDGRQLWISHAGVHQISHVQIGLVHELLDGLVPAELASLKDGAGENIWVRIQRDRSQIVELENDLTALYIAGAIRRFPSGGKGPQKLLLSTDEEQLFVANYFSGSVAVLGARDGQLRGAISLGVSPEPDAVRRGELIFQDATQAFQHWHSCATCHPNGGRVDGLRWDFLRDGIGNPKDTISLIMIGETPPHNWRATRQNARICAETSLVNGHLIAPAPKTVEDLLAYLLSLRPEPSPHLTPEGKLTEAALRGQALFQGKADCASCHPAPLFTDREMHNVGVLSPQEPDGRFDTPSLVEVGRTAPYLHDGRALTLKEVLTTHNQGKKHGRTRDLSAEEIDDLVDYLRSL